ncbi:MAG TPA: hypothetical protein VF658_03975 [Pyrinomonadaceae bacterium]|jgi:hypothetical protein
MNDKQRRRVERLMRSRDLATAQGGFTRASVGGTALAAITARIEEINNLAAERSTTLRAAQQSTGNRGDARNALRARLFAIIDTAETAALDFPEFKDKFRRPSTNLNDQNLLGTARSILAEATPHAARFIEYDMPEDFLNVFGATIADFEQAINQQNASKSGSSAANLAIDAALDAAELDLERLDTALRNKHAANAGILAAWKSASRLHSAPRKLKSPAPPPTEQTSAAASGRPEPKAEAESEAGD